MDTESQAISKASCPHTGQVAVNAAALQQFLSACPDGCVVEGTLADSVLHLEAGTLSGDLLPVPSEQFPRMSRPTDETEVEGGAEFVIRLSQFCGDASEGFRGGVFISQGRIGAMDGPRVGSQPCQVGVRATIPKDAAPLLAKMHDPRLFVSDRFWRAEGEGVSICGKLIEQSPDDRWVNLTEDGDYLFSCDADDLLGSIRGAISGGAKSVLFETGEGLVTVSGEEFGSGVKACSAQATAEIEVACVFALPVSQISHCLGYFKGCVVDVLATERAIQFKPHGRDDQVLLMQYRHRATRLPDGKMAA